MLFKLHFANDRRQHPFLSLQDFKQAVTEMQGMRLMAM